MLEFLLSPLVIALSFTTSVGVFVHEAKFDRLAAMSLVSPVMIARQASILLQSTPHTHIETVSSLTSVSGEQIPGLTPRRDRDENYRLQKYIPRGVHVFDSYHVPLKV